MSDLKVKINELFDKVSSNTFLNKEALGGEIPFFIFPYDAKEENQVQDHIKKLKNKLEVNGVAVLEINLYDLVIEILDEKGGVERMFAVEKGRDKSKFLKALQSTLNIQTVLMPKIKIAIDSSNAQVYFLTGIGQVFPFIRSHIILNNLQNIAKESPTLAFFPGDYNGHSLNLFSLLKDDNYYRAFNINIIQTHT